MVIGESSRAERHSENFPTGLQGCRYASQLTWLSEPPLSLSGPNITPNGLSGCPLLLGSYSVYLLGIGLGLSRRRSGKSQLPMVPVRLNPVPWASKLTTGTLVTFY